MQLAPLPDGLQTTLLGPSGRPLRGHVASVLLLGPGCVVGNL